MVFSEIFIRRPIMTTLVIVATFIFGIAAYFKLPISDLPNVDYPVMTISVTYPGASPSTMASTIASPLENECMQIPGLQSIISSNQEGYTQITLTFDLSRNVDLAAPDVQAAISRAMANLPSDLPQQPTYSKMNPSEAPILYIMLTSDTITKGDLYDFGNRTIGQRLSMINGVSQVQVWGAKSAIRIQVNPEKLASYGIGINQVQQTLQTGTVTIPGGSLNGTSRTFAIEPKGQLLKASDYEELIVTYRNNAPVKLKDIATCIDSVDNDVVNVTTGKTGAKIHPGSVVIAASRQADANTVAVSQRIKDKIKELKSEIPGSIDMDIFYDSAVPIIESVKDVKTTIIIAIILVVFVIFLFLGRVSDTLIPGIVLPISIVATFILMMVYGFSLDTLSLMGLTLSVGFLVDDAIVILENTVRHVQGGKKPFLAAITSMKEITGTVISTSIALITVFIPLIFMAGVVGRNFREFALTVVFTIICSTLMALTLSPMMCARVLKPAKEGKTKLENFTDTFVGGIVRKYGIALKWVLQHKFISVLAWIICIAGTILFFIFLPKTFMPIGDSGAIMGQMVMAQGTSTRQMQEFQKEVNDIFMNDPNIDRVLTVSGLQLGADQTTGIIYVTLKSLKQRKPIKEVAQELERKFAELPEGFVYIEPIPVTMLSAGGESTALGSKYSYIITGEDKEKVYKNASELEEKLKSSSTFTGIQSSIKLNMPQLEVNILRDRASTFGLTAADIENALLLAYAGGKVTTYKTDVDQYDVILELEKEYQKKPENLSTIYISSPTTEKLVPLGSVATWKETVGAQNVPHSNQLNSATISFNLAPGVPLGNATKELNNITNNILTPDVFGNFQGEAQEFEDATASLGILLLVAIFIMYVILGILYESYIHPFTILTTLPVAAFGGLATLLIFRSELSLYAYIGTFMLLGIVSKNGIMMVDFAKQNMEEGNNSFDAIYNACLIRFRPILMTGLSTIMGALPIALGFGADGASRRPLGLIIVGGLAFAQVITLFVTPGFYLYMQNFQEKVLDRFELTRSITARKDKDTVGFSQPRTEKSN